MCPACSSVFAGPTTNPKKKSVFEKLQSARKQLNFESDKDDISSVNIKVLQKRIYKCKKKLDESSEDDSYSIEKDEDTHSNNNNVNNSNNKNNINSNTDNINITLHNVPKKAIDKNILSDPPLLIARKPFTFMENPYNKMKSKTSPSVNNENKIKKLRIRIHNKNKNNNPQQCGIPPVVIIENVSATNDINSVGITYEKKLSAQR